MSLRLKKLQGIRAGQEIRSRSVIGSKKKKVVAVSGGFDLLLLTNSYL